MRKILFAIAIGAFSVLFMASCESDMPDFAGGEKPSPTETQEINEWVYSKMSENYLWTIGSADDYDFALLPQDFLNSLINNTNREKYATVGKVTDVPTPTPTYDIGFEYGANHYTEDDKMYYVVYYTKPGTTAHGNMQHGDNIVSVNNVMVDKNNYKTLLPEAIEKGGTIQLAYMRPPASNPVEIPVELKAATAENPVYAVKDTLISLFVGRVGYLAYNMFNSSYDKELMSALSTLKDKNINYLVLDLRYNGGGSYQSAAYLGSALVKAEAESPFIVYEGRSGSKLGSIKIKDEFKVNQETVTIPKLGEQLQKIYVIIGKSTSTVSNVFINALKGYYGSRLTLIGEEQYFENESSKTEKVEDNILLRYGTNGDKSYFVTTEGNKWTLEYPFAYATNINDEGSDKNKPYPYGFVPNILAEDFNSKKVEVMLPLGNTGERIFKEIIADVKGLRSTFAPVSATSDSYNMPISIMSKPWAGKSVVDVDLE